MCIKLVVSNLLIVNTLFMGSAIASPHISDVQLKGLSKYNANAVVEVSGGGFGYKEQAAPILLDLAEIAFENGIPNTHQAEFESGHSIQKVELDRKSIWEKPSNGVLSTISLERIREPRSPESKAHYYFEGENAFLGWPSAYGGSQTPVDNSQLYVAWWYKPKYDPKYYWAFSPIDQSKNFIKGETIIFDGGTGTYIGVDRDGLINAVFPGQGNANNMKGKIIKGKLSGATTVFPTEFRAGSGTGYETPGAQKYIRVWEDPYGKEGIRFSWTQMHMASNGVTNWKSKSLQGGEWNLLELEMDTKLGKAATYINGDKFSEFSFGADKAAQGKWSPTVALIGLNGKVGKLQVGEIDDIYIDKSLQRVIVGNAPEYRQLTHYELQRPISWSDDKITFEARFGPMSTSQPLYVYIFDKNGDVNKFGYPLCKLCSPPGTITLEIE